MEDRQTSSSDYSLSTIAVFFKIIIADNNSVAQEPSKLIDTGFVFVY